MKRLFCFLVLASALIGTMKAQDKTTMLEVHDFTGFPNKNQGTNITWGQQSGDDLNSSWDRVTLVSITGTVNGVSTTRNYLSWIDGKPRFSMGQGDSDWQYWDNGWQMTRDTPKSFFINRLDAGDKVTIEYRTQQTLHMLSENTSLAKNAQIISGQEFTVNSAGGVEIECSNQWAVIYRVTIATKHLATYEIDHQTYTFTSGGVLPDKRKAVPYITMTFGNENMDYAYVRYYGEENGVKQFGSFMLTETMNDTNFKDFNTHQDYYQTVTNWNNANGPYVLKEPVVFKGANFTEYVPWHGTYYYFYPETNGKLYIHWHSVPVTKDLGDPGAKWDNIFLWDKTSNNGADASSVSYSNEGFYKFGSNPQNGVRVKKDHVYFMCTTPNDARRRNVAHLIDYTFVPDFTMTPLYKVIEHGYEPQTSGEIAVSNLMYTDNNPNLHYRVKKCLGNIADAEVTIKNNKLYFTKITYKSGDKVNKGGSVIVDVDCTDGQADFVLTVPYSAEPLDGTGAEIKRWDFYTNIIDNEPVEYNYDNNYEPFSQAKEPLHGKVHLGQWYNDQSGLYYETSIKVPGEWLKTYMNLDDNTEPIFKNVYDMEGDNADMIWDTNGLIMHAHSGKTGFFNENNPSTSSVQDRYLAMLETARLEIPRLKAGDRVRIHMGRYGNAEATDTHEEEHDAHLIINNGKDVSFTNGVETGKLIMDDYEVGGTQLRMEDGKLVKAGVYNFIVDHDGTDGDEFSIEMKEGTLLKIYDIMIYTADEIFQDDNKLEATENSTYEVLFTDDDSEGTEQEMKYKLHYTGIEEPAALLAVDKLRGNLELTTDDFDVNIDDETGQDGLFSTNVTKGDFGSYRLIAGCKTQDGKYVTDYVNRSMAVGLREAKTYPYTWDFTDLSGYVADDCATENHATTQDYDGWHLTDDGYQLRNAPDLKPGVLFATGGQLYAGDKMFAEAEGLGFKRSTDKEDEIHTVNGGVRVVLGGLRLYNANGTFHKIVVPKSQDDEVKDIAIYVRATPISGADNSKTLCSVGDATTGRAFDKTLSVDGDEIYIMKAKSNQDAELWFNGVSIKKIAVSECAKTVNKLGYATESRDVEIDPELMSFMTGAGLKAYIISEVTYGSKAGDIPSISLSPISNTNVIGPATTGDHNGYIIYNTDAANNGTKAVDLVYGGFHIFAPDMHDSPSLAGTGAKKTTLKVVDDGNPLNYLVSWVEGGSIDQEDGDYTNYLMNYKYTGPDGKQHEGPEAFYRASSTATLGANKAYLQLETEKVKPSSANNNGAKFAIIFVDEDECTQTTALDGVQTTEMLSGDNAIYTLSGVKVSKPEKGSIYVKNGKKFIVK